jgi:lipid-binding SYLF domain-containing protein
MTSPIRLKTITAGLLLLSAASLPLGQGAIAQSNGKNSKEQASKLTPEQKEAARNAELKMAATGLEKLYAVQPDARKSVEGAVGYAVFDITSIYAILFVGQKGKGVLFDNATKKTTFMLSTRAGTGPGVGKQRVYQIFVFKTKGALDQFVLTGGTGGDVSATVSTGTGGMVRSFNPNIDVYQIPESGMAVQASWGGTVYTVDSDLN